MNKQVKLIQVQLKDLVRGENARATKPSKESVADLARSIALHGILVPLIATLKDGKYHLKGGYTRVSALELIKSDAALKELAKMNDVDLETAPVRIWESTTSDLWIPILENSIREAWFKPEWTKYNLVFSFYGKILKIIIP